MRVRWTIRARWDLLAIAEYIARDNPRGARRFTGQLRDRARRAGAMPGTGRVVPEYGREDVREVLLGNYRIIYAVRADALYVITVLEGHRQLRTDEIDPFAP